MKIAIVMPVAERRGGAELTLWHLAQLGPATNNEWLVIFLEPGPMAAQVRALGLEVEVVDAGHLRNLPRFVSTVTQIAAILRRTQAGVVIGWMSKAHLYSGPAARLVGVPALWFQHGIPISRHWMDRLATRLPAQGILTCSQAAADAQARLTPRRPLRVVNPGVELERFDAARLSPPVEMRRRLGLPTQGPLIGTVARLQRQKGIHILIEAFAQVLREHPEAHCVIVGGEHTLEPDYPAYLEKQIKTLGLVEKVTFSGLQHNIPDWVQAMDVFVQSSEHEGFGLVIIEALALGKPVIAGNQGGPTEIITSGVDGLLTPFGDVNALAAAVNRCLDDPAFAQSLAAAARIRAAEFSTARYVHNFITAVEQLMGRSMESSDIILS